MTPPQKSSAVQLQRGIVPDTPNERMPCTYMVVREKKNDLPCVVLYVAFTVVSLWTVMRYCTVPHDPKRVEMLPPFFFFRSFIICCINVAATQAVCTVFFFFLFFLFF